MPSFRTGTVTALLSERPGLQRVEVDGRRAYVLTQLIGIVAVGDRVVVNTTAVELGLGTGGWDVVHWNLANEVLDLAGGGHVMKLRYTSLQVDTGVAEEHLQLAGRIDGTPVVALALHSQLATVAAAVKTTRPTARVVYVMTDAASLPIALSDLVASLRGAQIIDGTVTSGHAFGGDAEAVNVASGLTIAKHHLGADVVLVGMGLGSVGTGTELGFGGLEVGATLDTIGHLGGRAIAALRVSSADPRERHVGLSHHSDRALRAARRAFIAPVPRNLLDLTIPAPASVVMVDVPDAVAYLAERGIAPTTMGRGPDEDPDAFAFAAAAGAYAAECLGK